MKTIKENKNPNPQAFPQEWTQNGTTDNWENGMSLRDYFAAKAMASLSGPTFYHGGKETEESVENFAKRCYMIADEMLKQRQYENK